MVNIGRKKVDKLKKIKAFYLHFSSNKFYWMNPLTKWIFINDDQKQAAAFMEKVRGAVLKYMTA